MNTKPKFTLPLLAVLLLWMLFILAGYYIVHKPLDPGAFGRWLLVIVDLIGGLGTVVLCGALGRKLFKGALLNSLERMAVQAALGAVIVGLAWLLFGVLHLYLRWLAWAVFAAGAILLRREVAGWCRDLADIGAYWKGAGRLEKAAAVGMGLLVVFQLCYAAAPPLKWDALTYHLQLPRQYIDARGLVFVAQNPYWGHPQLAEMLFTFAFTLSRAQTAAVTGWGFGMLFFIGTLGFTRRLAQRFSPGTRSIDAGWVAAAALLAGVTTRYLAGWAYTDLFAALFGLAAVVTFMQWTEENTNAWLRWSFLFAAAAATVKWTNGVLLLGLIACLPFLWKKMRFSPWVIIQGLLIALAVALPLLLKNLVVTGDPLYPYLLPTADFSRERVALANGGFADVALWERIFLPFAVTFMGVDTAAGFNFDPGPLLLLLGLPGLICCWKEGKVRLLLVMILPAAFAVGILSIWFGHLVQPRLFLAVLPVFAALAGLGWSWISGLVLLNIRMRRIMGAAVVVVLVLCITQDASKIIQLNPAQALISNSYEKEYFEKGLGAYQGAVERIHSLPVEERVLMLWEPRGLYMPLNSAPDLWIDRLKTDMREVGAAPAIIEKWCEQGFTRVLVYKLGESTLTAAEVQVYQELRNSMPGEEHINNWYELFRLPCAH